mgnify:FL=1|tara:strand:- start:56 stop:682 length:627 start_codon:yes stop_codon:yes gene_type:complete
MPVVINGNGTITGLNVGGLPNGIVDTDMLAANAVSEAKLATDAKRAYAHFTYAHASTHLSLASGSGGTHVAFTHVKSEQGITGDTTDNDWTHATTGYYQLQIRYRQHSGGDVWSIFGVTKDGNSDCVGISARTGSENSHNEAYDVLYKVDSTSATYQLMGWCGNTTKDVTDPDAQGKPTWTNYDTLVGYTGTNGGVMLDMIINKIGDL